MIVNVASIIAFISSHSYLTKGKGYEKAPICGESNTTAFTFEQAKKIILSNLLINLKRTYARQKKV